MKTITPTQLRTDIYNLLDEILKTGNPLEIIKGNKRLVIYPMDKVNKLQNLPPLPGVILGDADDLVNINWVDEVNLDLP